MLSRHDVLELRIQSTYIKNVETVKYLEICIDEELRWNFQIEQMCSKIVKMIDFRGRLRYFENESI